MTSTTLQVLTANRLRDGVVVYLGPEAQWVEQFDGAEAASGETDSDRLQTVADAAVRDRLIVGPYLFAVDRGPLGLLPLSQRERIRAAGPTVGTDLPATKAEV